MLYADCADTYYNNVLFGENFMDNTFDKYDSSYNSNFSFDDVNTEKLDMYGVWIKKKPDSDKAAPSDLQSDSVLDGSFAGDDAFLVSDNFDDDAVFQEMEPLEDTPADSLPDLSFDGLEALESEDDEILDLDSFDTENTDTESDDADSDAALEEDSFEALDLDDFFDGDDSDEAESDEETGTESTETHDADFDSDSDMEEVTLDDVNAPEHEVSPDSAADLDSFSEISLDDFDDIPEFTDKEDDTVGNTDEFETVEDFDDFADSKNESAAPAGKAEGVFDLTISDEDEKNSQQDITEITAHNSGDDIAIFDDVQAVEEDLLSESAVAKPSAPVSAASAPAAPDKSTELLLQIASEINGIKAELNSLKESISSKMMPNPSVSAPVDTLPHTEEEDQEKQEANTGFFNDDDTDETISLTGDELNNILITADFTTEKPEDAMQQSEEYEIPEVLTDEMVEGLKTAQTADSEFEKSLTDGMPPIENADEAFVHTDDSEAQAKGEELLSTDPVFNVEALPVTPLPEDLSYLDEETVDDADKLDLIDGIDTAAEAIYEQQDDVDADDDSLDELTDNLTIEDFEVPVEQDVPVLNEESSDAIADNDKPVIHEIFTDEDIPELDPDDEDDFSDDVFMDASDIPELQNDETFFGADMDVPELPEADEPELEEPISPAPVSCEPKQDTLLKAAEQIIKEEQEKVVSIPVELKNEIKSVLAYMDQLLEALPEKKIEEFAKSEYFETYKHLFEELGIS